LTKQPFLCHNFPQKILPELSIPCMSCTRKLDHPVFTSLDFIAIFFFSQSEVVSLTSNTLPGGPGLSIYIHQ
jgi:hypothetical protein